jgi:hypothetical protein
MSGNNKWDQTRVRQTGVSQETAPRKEGVSKPNKESHITMLPPTCQHVAARAHGAADEHGLTNELIINRDEWMVRGEGTRRSFPMDQQTLPFPLHNMLLHLGDVVRNIIDQMLRRGGRGVESGEAHDKAHDKAPPRESLESTRELKRTISRSSGVVPNCLANACLTRNVMLDRFTHA